MTHTLRSRMLNVSPISCRTAGPDTTSKEDKDKHRSVADECNHCDCNETVLSAHRRDPRVNTVIDRKAERVSDDDYRGDEFATQVSVCRSSILNRSRQAQCTRNCQKTLSKHHAKPVDLAGAHTPQDHGEGDAD